MRGRETSRQTSETAFSFSVDAGTVSCWARFSGVSGWI
jgi:hypothetical protein